MAFIYPMITVIAGFSKAKDCLITMLERLQEKMIIYLPVQPMARFSELSLEILILQTINKNIDLLGNKLKEYETQEQRTAINIESLSNGVYFLKIGNEVKMFVKE